MSAVETYQSSFQFLEPVSQIPPVKRRKRSIYKEIIDEFVASGLNCAEVKNIGRTPQNVYFMLSSVLKKENIKNVKVRMRNKKVYLEKVNMQDLPLNNYISEPNAMPETQDQTYHIQPIIDIMHLLNTYVVKLKCPRCNALNSKDARFCRDCRINFYGNEEDYRYQLEKLEELERKLNPKENKSDSS